MTRSIWLLLLLVATTALVHRGVLADSAAEEPEYANDEYEGEDGEHIDEDEDEESYTGPPPVINSKARELSVKPGENVRFPCEVDHAEDVSILWKKNEILMLFTDNIRSISDKRFDKTKDNALEIKGVKPSDAGKYKCELGTKDNLSVTHTLHILLTPRIEKLLPGPTKVIRKGNPLTLECKVNGYPMPSVTWSRKDKNLPDGEEAVEGNAVTFDSVTRKHSGVYECMASNGIGEPATATVDVHVEYAPEIEIEREIVNSDEGNDAELVCEVHAEPKPKVGWFKDGKPISTRGNDRMISTRQGSRHILQIMRTTKNDFGSYTCHANNTLGRIDKVIRLSGEPSPAKYISTVEGEDGTSRTLEWVVESHSPITMYELRYKTKQMSEWKTLHPVVVNPEGNVYTVQQELRDLSSGQYETVLLSKNMYGWSEPSIAHMFDIQKPRLMIAGASGIAEPSMGEASEAAAAQSPLLALLTILSLSSFFL